FFPAPLEILSALPNLCRMVARTIFNAYQGPRFMNRIQVSLLGALLAFGLALPPETAGAQSVPAASVQTLPDFADLVEKYGPPVVNINTQARRTQTAAVPGLSEDDPFYEFFRRFMPPEQQAK